MNSSIVIFKDFGEVPCGQKNVKTLKIENKTKNVETIQIQHRIQEGEIINRKLLIQPEQVSVKPKEIITFKLTYFSGVEDVVDNFYFDIFHSEEAVALLIVRAKSVGPKLTPREFNLKFFRSLNVNRTVKNIEITNQGKKDAKFYFDVEEDKHQIEISRRRGIIQAGHKFGIKISFNPTQTGAFFKKIFCLVQFHEPLIFNIYAVNFPKSKLDPKTICLIKPPELTHCTGYDAYMGYDDIILQVENTAGRKDPCETNVPVGKEINDNTEESDTCMSSAVILTPSLSLKDRDTINVFLTKRYIDMGNSCEMTDATALINFSMNQVYYYEWSEDPSCTFHVSPCRGFLKANSTAGFCVYFSPPALDNLYHAEFDVRVYKYKEESECENAIELPFTFTIRVNAHSFPNDGCGWIPQCIISPKTLYLSHCAPGDIHYGTFVMEHKGHLPINYCISPPKDPSFAVLPTVGRLTKEYHIFVVRFNSTSKAPGTYLEDVEIKLNGFDLNIETVRVVATVELPKITIGRNNSANFATIFPGSQTVNTISLKNFSNLPVKYKCEVPKGLGWIEIDNPIGMLEPKGIGEIGIMFKPFLPLEYRDYIKCTIHPVTNPHVVEVANFRVRGSGEYGYLVATPSIYDFGQCIYNTEYTIKIHLFNFSSALLFFQLKPVNLNFDGGDVKRDVKLHPEKGSVSAKGSVEVEVTIIPHKLEIFKYDIECQNFRDETFESKACETSKSVLSLSFEGVLPTIQIADLILLKGGPLFNRHWLWETLCVDEINEALQSTEMEQELNINIPEQSIKSSPMTLSLAIQSNKYGPVLINIKSTTVCDCINESTGSVQECSHKKIISVHPQTVKLNPNEKEILIIKINYIFTTNALGVITFCFSDKRRLILKFPLVKLPDDEPTLSFYVKSTFRLRPVLLADPQPPLQLFWLYNNTDAPASYSVDMAALKDATTHQAFDCINPRGIVQPFTFHPLGIIFSPHELMTYSVNLIVNCQKRKKICLQGEGVLNSSQWQELMFKNIKPEQPIIKDEEIEIRCSEYIINIPFMRGFSRTKRLFFLQNESEISRWSFKWLRYTFENVFSVSVEPEVGILKPGEQVLMILTLESFYHSTTLDFSIPCEVSNYCQAVAHKESIMLQDLISKREEDNFTITEKGTFFEKTVIPIAPMPETYTIFITINANIISNVSVEEKLSQVQRESLRSEKKLTGRTESVFHLEPSVLSPVQGLLENLLWDILNSTTVAEKVKKKCESQDFIYRQIVPESKKKVEEFVRSLQIKPETYFIQKNLDYALLELLCKNLVPHKK